MRSATPLLVFITLAALSHAAALKPDPAKVCDACEAWNAPHEPFRVFGNTYWVGPAGLGSVLITTDQGLILLDGALPQSAALIDGNIRKLGFRTEDVKLIANSHAHYDHAGGIAALERLSGATVVASEAGAVALRQGGATADDPQHGFGAGPNAFPKVERVQAAGDGEAFRIGGVTLTAHWTPGHTPGSTTWTWRSCEGERCLDIVYADSLNAVSAPAFRFGADATRLEAFRRSIAKVGALPCDILLAVHPSFADMEGKLARRAAGNADAFVDPAGCRAYAAAAGKRLDERLAEEKRASAVTQ